MKQSKSISKVGWIPGNEDIKETWKCVMMEGGYDAINEKAKDRLVVSKHDAEGGKPPRKVRVTLTLTVEDVK